WKSSTPEPYHTEVLTIPIDEPNGVLRSWDVRAGWRAASPSCTAVIDRPYTVASAFPAWFVNITDFASGGHRDLAMDVSGYARVDRPGRLSIDLDRDMTMTGTIGSERVSSRDGATVAAELDAGVHRLDLHARLTRARWRLGAAQKDQGAVGAALPA